MSSSHLQMPPRFLESIRIPSEDGMNLDSSSVSEPMETETGSITSQSSKENELQEGNQNKRKKRGSTSSTAGFPPRNKPKISKDKSQVFKHSTKGFNYFLTRDQGSTSKGKASRGYFNKSCAETSEKLWYPTETDCAELLSISSSGSVMNTKLNSWFTTKIRKDPVRKSCWRTSWQSSTFSAPVSMEKDQISRGNLVQKSAKNKVLGELLIVQLTILAMMPEENQLVQQALKSEILERIRILEEYPGDLSKTQCKQLELLQGSWQQFLDGNLSGDLSELVKKQDQLTELLCSKIEVLEPHVIRAKKVRIIKLSKETRSTLRRYMRLSRKVFNKCVDMYNKGVPKGKIRDLCIRSKNNNDLANLPEHIKQKAYDKFSSSLSSCISNEGKLHYINSKKATSWVGFQKRDCFFDGKSLKLHGKITLSLNESFLSGKSHQDLEITEKAGYFYVSVPRLIPFSKLSEYETCSVKTCGLDMGERTFGSLYDPDGMIALIGTDVNEKVKNRLKFMWKLSCALKRQDLSPKLRSRIMKAKERASAKLKNMIKELHHRVATWLVQKYDVIVIGKLGIGVMKCKRKGKRVLQSLSHYSFRRILIQKASVYHKKVSVISEYFTSKQCDQCGKIKWDLGTNEEFSCVNCGVVIHRDIHSARGMLVKGVSNHVG